MTFPVNPSSPALAGITPAAPTSPPKERSMGEQLTHALSTDGVRQGFVEQATPLEPGSSALRDKPASISSMDRLEASNRGTLEKELGAPSKAQFRSPAPAIENTRIQGTACGSESTKPTGRLREALESVASQQRRLDEAIALARSGRTFSGQELLALQARTHRFAHDLNLVSKMIEQLSSGVRRTLETQI